MKSARNGKKIALATTTQGSPPDILLSFPKGKYFEAVTVFSFLSSLFLQQGIYKM